MYACASPLAPVSLAGKQTTGLTLLNAGCLYSYSSEVLRSRGDQTCASESTRRRIAVSDRNDFTARHDRIPRSRPTFVVKRLRHRQLYSQVDVLVISIIHRSMLMIRARLWGRGRRFPTISAWAFSVALHFGQSRGRRRDQRSGILILLIGIRFCVRER